MKINKEEIIIEKLDTKDIDNYIKLVEEVKKDMEHPDWLGDFKREDYEYLLSHGSLIYIWKYKDEYIASGMLIPATQRDLLKFNLDEIDANKTIEFGPEMVKDKYRGNGLQKDILNYLLDLSKNIGYENAATTIHPENIYSVQNVEKVGFNRVGQVELKRGPRVILIKKI